MFLPDSCDFLVCSCLETRDLVQYGKVCRDTRRAVKAYSSQAFQLRRTLHPFMSTTDVRLFRDLMRQTGTLISGPAALHFFCRTPINDDEQLDLYTEGENANDLASFIQALGYLYQPRAYQKPKVVKAVKDAIHRYVVRDSLLHNIPAVLDVLIFVRDEVRIRIMIADQSAMDSILDFHSTPVMNFISYRSAYSLFPQSTFLDKFGVLFAGNLPQHHIDKYTALGWQMRPSLSHDNYSDAPQELKSVVRYVGDKYTWTIDLDDCAESHDDPVLFNSWEIMWSYRAYAYIMPQLQRVLFLAPRRWIPSRIFATSAELKSFMEAIDILEANYKVQDDYDFIMAAVKSAGDHLFERSPPCLTDTLCLISYNSSFRGKRLPVVMSLDERLQEDMVSADYEHQQGGILPLPSDRGATDGTSSPSSSRDIEASPVAEEPQGAASPISDTYSISTAQTDTTDGVPDTHAIPVYYGSSSSEESEVPDEDEPPRKRARTDEPGWYRD